MLGFQFDRLRQIVTEGRCKAFDVETSRHSLGYNLPVAIAFGLATIVHVLRFQSIRLRS